MNSHPNFIKLGFTGIAALLIVLGCEKKEEETPASGGTTEDGSADKPSITLSGTFKSSCQALSGTTYGDGTHKKTQITFGLTSGANKYEYVTLYMNAGCTVNQYATSHKGTFTVESATTTPANGFGITFTTDQANLIVYTDAAYDDFSAGCSGTGSYSPAPSIKGIYTTYGCMNISNFEPAPGSYHNIVVLNGSTLQMAATGDNNEGFANSGSVPTTLSMTLTK